MGNRLRALLDGSALRFVLVGVVTLIHSTVDFIVSVLVWKPLRHVNSVAAISSAR